MDEYAKLAKQTVEEYVKNGKIISVPQNFPEELCARRAGVFVTIHKSKNLRGLPRGEQIYERVLRGCIGTYRPAQNNIAEEIIHNAIAACSNDPRFFPIAAEELSSLEYEVSVLREPEPIKNIKKHNPKKHGIIVCCADGRRGLLLPDLEGVDSTDKQIFIACQKGGIDPRSDDFQLYFFETEKHK